MKLLDGKKIASEICEEIKKEIEEKNITPGLGVILIGNKSDSVKYVNMKRKKCEKLGIFQKLIHLEECITDQEVIQKLERLNKDDKIHGILVQLPLPENLNTDIILSKIDPKKDVDGLHHRTMGRVTLNRNLTFYPCTPRGCIDLLRRYNLEIESKNIVIVGKSNIVGLPLSIMLMNLDATVSVCHHKTNNIKFYTQNADILIVACGVPNLVDETWIKKGVTILDVGITVTENGVVGDVNFERVKEKVNYITPVPGGIGPMTIAILMKQVFESYCSINNL
jgi:methylenetetrahydrofolate dehydrogenase (NADP+)/methenyltetrahydrofolate cyclohydrolase